MPDRIKGVLVAVFQSNKELERHARKTGFRLITSDLVPEDEAWVYRDTDVVKIKITELKGLE